MANIKASKIDIRKSAKRRITNAQKRARLRTFDKKIHQLVQENKLDEAQKAFQSYSSYLDRAGQKHLIHPGQANRRKSRIASLLNKSAKSA